MGGGWLAALGGYLFTYWNSKAVEERKARIERINRQLREFYGPLLACVTATKSAYNAMVKQHSPDATRSGFQKALSQDPEGPTAVAFRQWMSKVLQPLNERAAQIATDNVDLLEGSTIEPLLLQLVAHVYANRVILERWSQGDFKSFSVISYPNAIVSFVQKEFALMKKKQADLLGTSTMSRL
ncbi:hypothetical protein CEUSTIGMA_g917.t1 [Chlamydomonas eustigma]|uniref:Uncharacterized protein n=1 Tax=Chlamydomonas eustigma TaxID=1157962 RepID=A0A250WRK0_9CHLO|nr:hypothetical protein CEUSTIGMA_g917.t1 [Chlamydomonas eustigma]|eukprot:GAX73465.1 hypothetical protein CEUSTIGMA_g917.t1 [Chlamydomonas eustigma]